MSAEQVGRRSLNGWGIVLATLAMLVPAGAVQASSPYVEYVREPTKSPSVVLGCSASGRCELTNGVPVPTTRHFTLIRRRLAALQAALHDARWRSLRSQYAPSTPIKKLAYYDAVTYAGRRVSVSSLALQRKLVPQRLVRVLNVLKAIVAAH